MTHKALLLSLSLVAATAAGCARNLAREAPFRARPDSTAHGDLRGPFTGRVVDAETDRPIVGALVYASWRFASGYGFEQPAGWREFIGSTDSTGAYRIPRLEGGPGGARLSDFRVVIYKRGYVAYRSDRRFEDFGPRTDFAQRANVVVLARWRPELSHARHLRFVGGGPTLSELTSWEVADAVAELEGQRPVVAGGTRAPRGNPPPAAPGDGNLHAEGLLRPADVQGLTGYEGGFDVGELGDDPSSATYDTVHLQARGRPESYDVAMRVWKLPAEEADKQYARVVEELPGAQVKNEIGDKSVRAATPGGDILGLAFLEARKGYVVLLTCGASQCRSPETVLSLARVVRERLEALP